MHASVETRPVGLPYFTLPLRKTMLALRNSARRRPGPLRWDANKNQASPRRWGRLLTLLTSPRRRGVPGRR